MIGQTILRAQGIYHRYGETLALNGIDFNLLEGEIHALIGDHKAGKTTLIKLLTGALDLQEGSIQIDEKPYRTITPQRAKNLGVAIVQQKLTVVPHFSAVENVGLGTGSSFFLKKNAKKTVARRLEQTLSELGFEIDIHQPVSLLSSDEQQVIELARALTMNPRIIILDEISTRLKPAALNRLFATLKRRRDQGTTVLYVTPIVEEIFRIADRVTVIREGERIGTENVENLDRLRLLTMAYDFMSYLDEQNTTDKSSLYIRSYNENLVNNLPIGAVVFDAEGRVHSSNVEANKVLRISEEDSTRRSAAELLDFLQLEHRQDVAEAIESQERATWESLSMSGDRRARVRVHPVRNYTNQHLGTLMFIEDISMNQVVKDYLAQADQITSIAQLASGVAHEINNPLGVIQNNIELLKIADTEAERQEYIGDIEQEVNLIVEIVGGLLSFSRLRRLPPKTIDPVTLIDDALALLRHKLQAKRIHIKKTIHRSPVHVSGIETKLQQLMVNLINNAQEAMLEEGVLEIVVDQDQTGEYVEISVIDDGHGVPQEIQEEVFTPFFTTKMTRNNTGLGLSICRHIAEIHKGVLSFESRPGRTSFTLILSKVDGPVSPE